MTTRKFLVLILVALLALLPTAASADEDLPIGVSTAVSCDQVDFSINVTGGTAPYRVELNFGDGEIYEANNLVAIPDPIPHSYPAHGDYEWELKVWDNTGSSGEAQGSVVLNGPQVSLLSEPDPPLLTLMDGTASANFTAAVQDNLEDYSFEWTLEGEGTSEGNTAQVTYTEGGEYTASVTVTDNDGSTASDTDSESVMVNNVPSAIEIIKEARARVANKNKVVDAEVIEDA